MFAAVVLEQHGYPPLVLSFESIDHLDHVLFVYRHAGRWGSVARSRDPGLHGRKPVFKTPRALAVSYVDTYVDYTGGVRAHAVADMREMGAYDWRFNRRYVWPAEQYLLDYPHRPITTDPARIANLRRRYRQFRKRHDDMKPVDYMGREKWTPIPKGFLAAEGLPFDGPLNRDRNPASGRLIGSCLACRNASSKRFARSSPRVFSLATDFSKIASRRAASSATMRCAFISSGLSPRSGISCEMMRPRLRSKTRIAPQHGHGTSTSEVRRPMPVSYRTEPGSSRGSRSSRCSRSSRVHRFTGSRVHVFNE